MIITYHHKTPKERRLEREAAAAAARAAAPVDQEMVEQIKRMMGAGSVSEASKPLPTRSRIVHIPRRK